MWDLGWFLQNQSLQFAPCTSCLNFGHGDFSGLCLGLSLAFGALVRSQCRPKLWEHVQEALFQRYICVFLGGETGREPKKQIGQVHCLQGLILFYHRGKGPLGGTLANFFQRIFGVCSRFSRNKRLWTELCNFFLVISILIFCSLCWWFAKKNMSIFWADLSWTKNWCKFCFWSFDFGGLDLGVLILGVWILEFWFRGFGSWSFGFGGLDLGVLILDLGILIGSWSFDFGGLGFGVLILGEFCVPTWCFKTWGWENNFRPLDWTPRGCLT